MYAQANKEGIRKSRYSFFFLGWIGPQVLYPYCQILKTQPQRGRKKGRIRKTKETKERDNVGKTGDRKIR
jgi:hypothetical protein